MTGSQLKSKRKRMKLSQTRLARALGYRSFQTVSIWERRPAQPIPSLAALGVENLFGAWINLDQTAFHQYVNRLIRKRA